MAWNIIYAPPLLNTVISAVRGALGLSSSPPTVSNSGSSASISPNSTALSFVGISPSVAQGGGGVVVFDRFISLTGSNSNNGLTPATAYALSALTDTNALNSSLAQHKIGLVAGNYDISAMVSGSHNGNTGNNFDYPVLNLPAGTVANLTTLGSCDTSGNYSPRASTLNWGVGVSTTVNSVVGQNSGGSGNWALLGLVITGYTLSTGPGAGSASNKQVGWYPSGSAGPVIIQDCDFGNQIVGAVSNGSNDGSIFQDGATGMIIQNCKFHDVHKAGQTDHVHAFCEFSGTNTKFINNSVINCDTAIDGKVNDNNCLIARNYFFNCGIAGGDSAVIQGYDGDQNTTNTPHSFLNNIFDSCAGECRTVDVASNHIMQPNTVANNTVYYTTAGSNGIWDLRAGTNNTPGASAQGNITFHDNITVTTAATGGGSPSGRLGLTSGFVTLCDFNCYFPTNGNFNAMWALSGTSQSTLANWRSATGNDTHGIQVNPAFASTITPGAGAAQFQLAGGSPCLGTGTGGVNMGAWDGTVAQIGCNF